MTTDKELRCASCHEDMVLRNWAASGEYAVCRNVDCDEWAVPYKRPEAVARWENELEAIGQERNERNAR